MTVVDGDIHTVTDIYTVTYTVRALGLMLAKYQRQMVLQTSVTHWFKWCHTLVQMVIVVQMMKHSN